MKIYGYYPDCIALSSHLFFLQRYVCHYIKLLFHIVTPLVTDEMVSKDVRKERRYLSIVTENHYLTVMHEDIMIYTMLQKNKHINLYDLFVSVEVSLDFK